MNIIFIVPDYYPHIGGVERHTRAVAGQLVAQGHRLTVFVEKRRTADACHQVDQQVEIIRFVKKNYWIFRKVSFKYQFIKNFRLFAQADAIHFHDFSTFWLWGFAVYAVLRCLGKKIFITFHGWEGRVPPAKGIILKRKICAFLTHANICAGHFIEKWYGTRADRITYGGCTPPASPSETTRKNGLFVGRLEEDTGVREYILAWKTVNQLFPDLELIICGDGSRRQHLQEMAKEKNIKNIRFMGFVQEPEKMVARSVFVFTSGFLGILEAFARQTPVIAAYDNPLKKDYLTMLPGSDKMLWIAGSSDDIVAAVQEIQSSDIRKKLDTAYSFAMENSWQRVAADYLQLYKEHGCHV